MLRGTDGYNYVLKTNSWQGGGFTVTNARAGFSGKASLTVLDPPRTRRRQLHLPRRRDRQRLGRTTDTFALTVYDGSRRLYHQVGTITNQIALGGGDITVRTR